MGDLSVFLVGSLSQSSKVVHKKSLQSKKSPFRCCPAWHATWQEGRSRRSASPILRAVPLCAPWCGGGGGRAPRPRSQGRVHTVTRAWMHCGCAAAARARPDAERLAASCAAAARSRPAAAPGAGAGAGSAAFLVGRPALLCPRWSGGPKLWFRYLWELRPTPGGPTPAGTVPSGPSAPSIPHTLPGAAKRRARCGRPPVVGLCRRASGWLSPPNGGRGWLPQWPVRRHPAPPRLSRGAGIVPPHGVLPRAA